MGNIELAANIILVLETIKEKIQQKIKVNFDSEIDKEVTPPPPIAFFWSNLSTDEILGTL